MNPLQHGRRVRVFLLFLFLPNNHQSNYQKAELASSNLCHIFQGSTARTYKLLRYWEIFPERTRTFMALYSPILIIKSHESIHNAAVSPYSCCAVVQSKKSPGEQKEGVNKCYHRHMVEWHSCPYPDWLTQLVFIYISSETNSTVMCSFDNT